jgi:hypothetical protein
MQRRFLSAFLRHVNDVLRADLPKNPEGDDVDAEIVRQGDQRSAALKRCDDELDGAAENSYSATSSG